jgi:hypothetical protein
MKSTHNTGLDLAAGAEMNGIPYRTRCTGTLPIRPDSNARLQLCG